MSTTNVGSEKLKALMSRRIERERMLRHIRVAEHNEQFHSASIAMHAIWASQSKKAA